MRRFPGFDAVRIEHLVVAGELATVYRAVLEADFLDTRADSVPPVTGQRCQCAVPQ